MKKGIFTLCFITTVFAWQQVSGQNAIIGSDFSTGWGGGCNSNSNFTYFGSSAGTTYIATRQPSGGTSGDKFWRFGVDWGGTVSQLTITLGSDVVVSPGIKYSLNSACTTSGSLKYTVPSGGGSWNYVFKTLDAGSTPTGTIVFFEVQGAVQTFSSHTAPASSSVYPGVSQRLTVTMSGVLNTGQAAYVRYTTGAYSSATITQLTYSGSGNNYYVDIPGAINTSGATINYYFFSSGSGLTISNTDADLFSINLLNNSGSNYSYTVSGNWQAITDGNWSTSGTWNANQVPPSNVSVTINANVIQDINATVSTLTINSGKTFTSSDGTARTLTINNSTSGITTTLANNGTWANGTGGSTVVFTGAPGSGDAIHAITGTISFQNITINKTGGSSNVGASFGSYSTLTGTLEIGSGGFISTDPPTGFYNTNAILKFNQGSGATYNVNSGDKTWSTSVIPNNITISSGTVSLNDSRIAVGNLVIDGGTLNLAANLTINGNWTRSSGAFTPGTYTVTLSGTTNGNVNVTGGGLMYNVVIDKTSGAVVTLLSSLTVTNALTINSEAQLTLASGNSLSAGTFTINSNVNSTGTFVDANTSGNHLTVSGTTSVNQYLTASRNWYISSPVSGATSNVFYNTSNSSMENLYWYDETKGGTSSNWPQITDNATSLSVGRGYVANVDANFLTATNGVTFTGGTLNTGDTKTPLLTRTSGPFQGYNLVGNPYPSDITMTYSILNGAGLLNSIWYRTASYDNVHSKYVYAFNTFLMNSDGSSVPSPSGTTGIVPPMQAFWVNTNVNGNQLTFTNGMRSHQTSNPLKAKSGNNVIMPLLRLQVSNSSSISDETVVYFNSNASNAYDSYDALKMSNAAIPEIYTTVGTEQLVINGMNSIPYNTELPLGFTTGQSDVFTIKATEFSNFDANTKVYLKDNLLNTLQDLTDGTAYAFASDVASTTSRFSVVFKSVGVTTGVQAASGDQSILIYKNANNQIAVNCSGSISDNAFISVYNALGQKLESKQLTTATTFISRTFASGVYVVTVINGGKSTTRKVILN